MKSINVCDLGCSDRDCISYLPEDVLSEILSRLPTKDVVRTSILSKAWEFKWTSMYNVDIYDGIYDIFPEQAGMFANFMDRIIRSCKHVNNFRLHCGAFYELERVNAWISAALRHKLESFEVLCSVEGVVYPCSLLNIASLRNLVVHNGTLNVATKNIVANLIHLELLEVEIVNKDPNTSTVAFTFPLLETLRVHMCSWLKPVEINAPSLTAFSSSSQIMWEWNPCSFSLIAPRLDRLNASFGFPENFILTGSAVVSANIQFTCDDQSSDSRRGIRVGNLLNQLKNVKHLDLENDVIKVLRFGSPLYCHDNLTTLTINGIVKLGFLCHILHAAPSLKYMEMRSNCTKFDIDNEEGEVETVPSCIVYQLETVVFFSDYPFEQVRYNLAKFLLKNGGALKKIRLDGYGSELLCPDRFKVRDTLLGFPRLSGTVIIE